MKKLPPIRGLLCEATLRKRTATDHARRAQTPSTCPREAHECRLSADREAKIAGELEAIAADDADLVVQIETMIEWIAGKRALLTPARQAAAAHLATASMTLRREIGDAPTQ